MKKPNKLIINGLC